VDQPVGELAKPPQAHEEDERPTDRRERRVVGRRSVGRVRRCDRHPVGDAAVRHRDPRGGGNGGDRRDARDDLERDSRLGERERLLATPPEDVGVAALEADNLEALPTERDEQVVDLLL